ncbi:hypothetical protein ASF83_08195 [Plantibacter sp. Leaf171]|jgi:hypothetical protein|uniref:DUF6121 family protein n=1 Tax=unclassified Plantibacter TaxID=2624265 RepID=UPI0006FC7BA9|nr:MULTISPECIES: DUF6121 family protein [unclassified Plantibacter]KQM15891.1 hypothetical protein ASE44_08210 [Plantibacter sp. Leaf1]KQR59034.1 hypothetical protein ASF83_08195 [Plantibacter sp. Leaf171]
MTDREREHGAPGPWWVAPFAAITYVALVVCAFGFISLLADLDVVTDPDAGPLTGPLMVVVAALVVLWAIIRETRRTPVRVSVGSAVLAGLLAWLAYGVSGGIFDAVASRDGADAAAFAVTTLTGPFSVTVGVLALVIVLAAAAVATSSTGGRPTPRWPWEHGGI